jgi:preprotein translocase subunit SecA
MRLFASDRVTSIMERLKWPDDEPIQAKMVTKAIESAQRQVEELNFTRRKNVLKYDEVPNTQRTVIYAERRKVLEGHDLKDEALDMIADVVDATVTQYVTKETFPEDWDLASLVAALGGIYPTQLTPERLGESHDADEVLELVLTEASERYATKEQEVGSATMRDLERMVMLNITDNLWRQHLYEMDYLEEGIHLRAYGQRDPLTEYQREAFTMFEEMKAELREEFVRYIYRVELVREQEAKPQRVQTNVSESDGVPAQTQATSDKVGRNSPCPCGSGRKYKKCHGATAAV